MPYKKRLCLVKGLLFVLFLGANLLAGQNTAVGQTSKETNGCDLGGVSLAHCDSSTRNFNSVLLAVHGWGGSCKTTFGEGENTLFNALPTLFFDIDCFDYDSLGTPLRQLARDFTAHIKSLQKRGYQEVYILTHSMGGLIALQAYTDALLNPDNSLRDSSEFKEQIIYSEIDAWAVPIDGLRDYIIVTDTAVRWMPFLYSIARAIFGDDRLRANITVPEMEEGSEFLTQLKNRLAIIKGLREDLEIDDPARPLLIVNVVLHLGKKADKIVNPFNISEIKNPTWKWDDLDIINTDETHSNNIGNAGESGDIGMPRYPTEIVGLRVLNRIPLLPRTKSVFPQVYETADWNSVPESIEERQLIIVNALAYVSRAKPSAFDDSIIQFLKYFYNESFYRSPKVDQALIDGLFGNVTKKIKDKPLAKFYIDLIYEVFDGYDPIEKDIPKELLAKRFGSGYETTEKLVLDFVQIIWRRLKAYFEDDPKAFKQFALKTGGFKSLETKVASITIRFLNSRHDSVQKNTLDAVNSFVQISSVQSILDSELLVKLTQYLRGAYDKILQPEKNVIADIYKTLYNKPELAEELVLTANEIVSYQGKKVPIILTLNNEKITTIHGEVLSESDVDLSQKVAFFSSVAARGGTLGSNFNEAGRALFELEILSSKYESVANNFMFKQAGQRILLDSQYPGLIEKLNSGGLFAR